MSKNRIKKKHAKQCIEVTRRPKMPKNGKSPSDAHICGAERCKVAVSGWWCEVADGAQAQMTRLNASFGLFL